jgi:anaerobic magnesium-protoporphyrin IX monomethyl ester cyclase
MKCIQHDKNGDPMTQKILLIRPSNVYNYNNYPPLNLILLGSSLRVAGFEIEIINSALEPDFFRHLKSSLPDALLVALTILTPEVPDALKIMKFIKENSEVPIVVGGWHCTLFPEQMAESKYVDYVIPGEGEEHIVALSRYLSEGKKPDKKICERKTLDLNSLPEPDYSLEPLIERFISSNLTDTFSRYVPEPIRWLPYESSRGCPSHCTFCINVVAQNTRYRKKSATKVIDEIEHIVKKFKISHVKIIDDNFFVDMARVRNICHGLIERKLTITWDAECRCDYFTDSLLNDDTLALAKKSGLVQLTLGIESGSQHTLDIMKKNITPQQAENAVRKCNQFGIVARSSFMIEVPGDTREDIQKTIMFMNKLSQYPYFSGALGTFRPYPKCELSEDLIKNGFLTEPQSLDEWTSPQLIDMYTAAEYIRPWQIDGNFSLRASFYKNIESQSRLGNHQIDNHLDLAINKLFIFIARIRNRLIFYSLPVDMELYKKFLVNFYRKKAEIEKNKGG